MTDSAKSPLTGRYSAAAHEKVDNLAERAHPAVDKLASGAHGAVDRLAEMADATSARVSAGTERFNATRERVSENCSAYVRENPLASLGIAFLAGVVLSRLLNTRD